MRTSIPGESDTILKWKEQASAFSKWKSALTNSPRSPRPKGIPLEPERGERESILSVSIKSCYFLPPPTFISGVSF